MADSRIVCQVVLPETVVRFAQQYPVFPCRQFPEYVTVRGEEVLKGAKTPYMTGGFKIATQDPEQIRAWWGRWPNALVGVPTGSRTGLVVVDYDVDKIDAAASEWVQDNVNELMATRIHGTLKGGRHYLFEGPTGIEYRGGASLQLAGIKRSGIDLRAEGGYIIWWPLHGGSSTGDIMPLPARLLEDRRIDVSNLPALPPANSKKWGADRSVVMDALAYLNPDNYDLWLRVGMALHLASGGADDGFQMWHAWSSGDLGHDCPPSYSGINDCRYHWASYRHDKPRDKTVTLGTIFKLAKDNGYVYKRVEIELPPLEVYDDDLAIPIPDEEKTLIELAAEAKKPTSNFRSAADIVANPIPIKWLIRPYLEQMVLGVLYGELGTMKSFLTLDMLLCIATGQPWGPSTFPVKPQPVAYVSAEGRGMDRRIRAWSKHRAIPMDGVPFYALERALDLSETGRVVALADDIAALGIVPAVIAIDTLSRNKGSLDENTTSDMSTFFSLLDMHLRHRFGCSVLVVHHVGHGAKDRARGSYTIMADTDANYQIERPDPQNPTIKITTGRLKDAESPKPFNLKARVINLDTVDEDGEPETSLVLIPTDEEPIAKERRPNGKAQLAILALLEQQYREGTKSWFQADIKKLGRERLGISKTSVQSAVFFLIQNGFIKQTMGTCVLTSPPQ